MWIDALASYLTGVGFPDDLATFERYWPADVHLVGKEIIRFHCLYWPALLLSAGLPLPRHVFAHGWLTKDGQKISKSTGNVIDPVALVDEFGADAVRYYFLRQVPFGQDGDYTRESFVRTYNADLANTFGNLVQRTTTLAARSAVSLAPVSRPRSQPPPMPAAATSATCQANPSQPSPPTRRRSRRSHSRLSGGQRAWGGQIPSAWPAATHPRGWLTRIRADPRLSWWPRRVSSPRARRRPMPPARRMTRSPP